MSNQVGPIMFGRERPRRQLLECEVVYSFRTRDRTTGETWARASRTGPKIADVTVENEKAIRRPTKQNLAEWADQSGFESVDEWWDAIVDVHGDSHDVGVIYRVSRGHDRDDDGHDAHSTTEFAEKNEAPKEESAQEPLVTGRVNKESDIE